MRQQQQNDSRPEMREGINFLLFICQVLAVTCEVFLHRRHGRRWPGLHGLWGVLLILLFPLFWPAEDAMPLIWFLWAYIGACALARIGALCRRYDYGTHSRYSGIPRISRLLRFLSESTIKRVIEPALVFSIGVACLSMNKPFGSYLILAALGLFISTGASDAWARSQADILNDSVIEQREIAERFRRS